MRWRAGRENRASPLATEQERNGEPAEYPGQLGQRDQAEQEEAEQTGTAVGSTAWPPGISGRPIPTVADAPSAWPRGCVVHRWSFVPGPVALMARSAGGLLVLAHLGRTWLQEHTERPASRSRPKKVHRIVTDQVILSEL